MVCNSAVMATVLVICCFFLLPPGSLDQLDTKTPPFSHKTRTFSTAEQEEQEAASGTRDRRVSRKVYLM